jgi:hypothetical protein
MEQSQKVPSSNMFDVCPTNEMDERKEFSKVEYRQTRLGSNQLVF